MFRADRRGFTLIELLVVIAIIGVLSSVVLSSVRSASTKSAVTRAKAEMKSFVQAVIVAQGESGKTLLKLSQDGGAGTPQCSQCACTAGTDLRNIASSNACYTNWAAILTGVQMNSNGLVTNLTAMNRDPWGSPYLVDQNQGEAGNCTAYDSLRSVGPDGTLGTSDDIAWTAGMPLSATCP